MVTWPSRRKIARSLHIRFNIDRNTLEIEADRDIFHFLWGNEGKENLCSERSLFLFGVEWEHPGLIYYRIFSVEWLELFKERIGLPLFPRCLDFYWNEYGDGYVDSNIVGPRSIEEKWPGLSSSANVSFISAANTWHTTCPIISLSTALLLQLTNWSYPDPPRFWICTVHHDVHWHQIHIGIRASISMHVVCDVASMIENYQMAWLLL